MKHLAAVVALAALTVPPAVHGQAGASAAKPAEPFKVGTFQINGAPKPALVFRDSIIVEVDEALRALEGGKGQAPPRDMLELIEQYDQGLRDRLYQVANTLVGKNQLTGNRPAYVHDLKAVGHLAPILYPGKILNAAVNFYSHVNESGTPEEQAAARRKRQTERGVPYMFLKPARGAVIGNGANVVLPWGRDRMDWEVELGAVIGRTGRYIEAANAQDHVFGYMVSVDVSDRGGRPPGGFSAGSDWFVGKGHDTSAPEGPWIVPKEFYGDPMKNLRQTLSVGGQVLQEARAGDMIHSLWELIEYASSISTLFPGDVINNGTSGGTAAGSAKTRTGDRFLKPGEVIEASIDGIGTLRMPVVAGEQPKGANGARLPPVSTYRKPTQ